MSSQQIFSGYVVGGRVPDGNLGGNDCPPPDASEVQTIPSTNWTIYRLCQQSGHYRITHGLDLNNPEQELQVFLQFIRVEANPDLYIHLRITNMGENSFDVISRGSTDVESDFMFMAILNNPPRPPRMS